MRPITTGRPLLKLARDFELLPVEQVALARLQLEFVGAFGFENVDDETRGVVGLGGQGQLQRPGAHGGCDPESRGAFEERRVGGA